MLGATGAVGNHAALTLASLPMVDRLSLLGRRPATNVIGRAVTQEVIDIFAPDTYRDLVGGHRAAICALGVGQPSKMTRDEFVRIDHDAVLDFASSCKGAGVRHFELLSSIGVNATAKSFYLRTKGKLEEALRALDFDRLSLFHPSMILTPTNRYGLAQGMALAATRAISPLLLGSLRRFRGIDASDLGQAMARNVLTPGEGEETLHWKDFRDLSRGNAEAG
ncbi:MAG: NAD(P)H-binding protein [Deltaproteobacteria bacterium]|nr:NAD(P)H-binding protein [Deltaproteobacteria bacterium]